MRDTRQIFRSGIRAIKGMRNLHAHDYENVDLEIVWYTLKEEISELKTQLETIMF